MADAEKIIDAFLGDSPAPETPAQDGPGRPTADQAAAREAARKDAEQQAAMQAMLPQLLEGFSEAARIPWDLWAERATNRLKVDCSFLMLSQAESERVATSSLPLLAKWVGPWVRDYGPEFALIACALTVTLPRIIQLRRLERILQANGGRLPEPPKPPPQPEPAPAPPVPEPAPAPPASIARKKRRGRPRK